MSLIIIKRIYPTPEHLSTVNNNVPCTEEGCTSVFKSESNLTLHLVKTHNKSKLLPNQIKCEYYCPVTDCSYKRSHAFKNMKLLKQHYLKVHAIRNFICELCTKTFPTKSYRDSHAEYCNVTFTCNDCKEYYSSYEALKTHCRRKNHKCLKKIEYKSNSQDLSTNTESQCTEQSSQTEYNDSNTNKNGTKKTQLLTVETQTNNDDYMAANKYLSEDDIVLAIKKNITTQTNVVSSKTTSCNTSFNLNDFEFSLDDTETQTSSTQTSQINNSLDNYISGISTTSPNNDDDSNHLLNTNFDPEFYNTETQTDSIFGEGLDNYCDFYNDMHTQTYDNILLNGICFNHNETQTVFDDILRSVESQTIMSDSRGNYISKDVNNMETQTDAFQKLVEEVMND